MNLPAKPVNPLDHAVRHTLRRQVARLGGAPGGDVRRQLLEQAAARAAGPRWLTWLTSEVLIFRPAHTPALDLGWRELASLYMVRPAGIFGAFSSSLR